MSMRKMTTATLAGVLALSGLSIPMSAAAAETAKPEATQPVAASSELSGKVLGSEGKTLYIEGNAGEAIPLHIDHQTLLSGAKVKDTSRIESNVRKNFAPGQEVRASFKVEKEHFGKMENRAISIDKK